LRLALQDRPAVPDQPGVLLPAFGAGEATQPVEDKIPPAAAVSADLTRPEPALSGRSPLLADASLSPSPAYPIAQEEQLLTAIRAGSPDPAERMLDCVMQPLTACSPQPEDLIRQVLSNITVNLRQLLFDFNESETDTTLAAGDVLERLEQSADPADAQRVVLTLIGQVSAICRKRALQAKSDIVLQAASFIEANYQTALTVNAIAAALFISAPYLYRLMREELGVSPAHYLVNLRIRHAMQLLRNTDGTIAQIANEAGFETEQGFFRQFRKQVDCTPNQYRNRYRT
jgi:AraC-like DNA-binding protein